jgi:tRNA (guanine-N7-)-methyltransferase
LAPLVAGGGALHFHLVARQVMTDSSVILPEGLRLVKKRGKQTPWASVAGLSVARRIGANPQPSEGDRVRMSKRIRQHVNPLRLGFIVTGAQPVPLPTDRPVEVDLGCADARWLFERAQADPTLALVGVEIREELALLVRRRARAAGLDVCIVFANINQDLDTLFEGGSVARFVLNFPDPWFKKRQRKRRLITDELARVLWRKLGASGQVFFQSDVWDLALDAMDVFERADDAFENVCGAWSFLRENPFGVRSKREAHCEESGRPIWRMLYRKTALSPR